MSSLARYIFDITSMEATVSSDVPSILALVSPITGAVPTTATPLGMD